MRLKLYRAASTAAAMALVRAELGPDALILSSRRCTGGVELTAALEPVEEMPPPPDRLAWHGVPPVLAAALPASRLAEALAATLRFAPLPLDGDDPPLLLVGPPGAGKTLTAARLATRLVLAGVPPLVVTADAQRAGAAEQLAAYTRLLGLSLTVAADPEMLQRALARRQAGAPVLIDAPGTDPFRAEQRAAIAALAEAVGATMALVLPAGLDPSEAADLACAYAEAGATLLVATRLDLARRLGAVLAAAAAGQLALAEAGIGPGAPEGLVPLTPDFLADRLLRPGMTA